MKKKNKQRMPLLVLAAFCITSAGVLAGCKNDPPPHTHNYTSWNHNETEHWKECPDDSAIDETTRENHEYVAGECECGAIEPVVPVKYGKLTGKVKLHKKGSYENDFTGVNLDLSDDGAELDFNAETGVFTFDHVKVGENHVLTVTKSGYRDYTIPAVQAEENQTATIGGEEGIVLEYDVFGYLENYDTELHDFSKVNEENPSILFKEHTGDKTMNVLTKESYTDVSATLRVNWNNSTHNWHTQGIVLKFEDGSHAIIRYHNGDQQNGNIQYANEMWNSKAEKSIFNADDLNQYGEKAVHTLFSSETNAIKNGDGLDLTVVVNGGKIYTYFAGNWISTYSIPESTVGKKVQVAYFAYNAANNSVFNYDISETVPSVTSTVNITVDKPADAEAATANVTADKESCGIGEKVILTVTKPIGYKLDTLLVNNVDLAGDVVDNTLTLTANRSEMNIEATFVKEAPMAINIAVKGKRFGSTVKLPENTEVKFKNTEYSFTVDAEGKIQNDSVVKGRYTVVVNGYFEKEITLDENLSEIVLEYDAFEIVRWDADGHDLSHVNEENPYIELKSGLSFNAISKQNLLGDAAISVILKASQTTDGDQQQGILLRFEDGKAAILNINTNGAYRLQYRPDLFPDNNDSSIGLHTAFNEDWVEFKTVTAAEVEKYNSDQGIELKVVRKGCDLIAFIDGRYIGTATLPSQYADDKMGFGFFGLNAVVGSKWYFDVSETLPSVTVKDTTSDTNGSLEIAQNSIELGDTVTITAKPNDGFKLASLSLNGNEVSLAEVANNTYTFVASQENYTVAATFEEEDKVESVIVPVTGNKLGVDGNALEGETVTLSDGTHTYSAIVESGSATFANVEVGGSYTLSAEGYLSATGIEVTKEGIGNAITLEYNTFSSGMQPTWGDFYLENQNEGIISATNECNGVLTNDYYQNFAISVNLSGHYSDGLICGGNQGISVKFENGEYVQLRVETMEDGSRKLQFAAPEWWQYASQADGAGWADLLYFADNQEYLDAYEAGTLKLTLVRDGSRFIAYLNGNYVAEQTVDVKYQETGAQIGIYWNNTDNGVRKDWTVEIETDISSYEIPPVQDSAE